jgi:hypothetical protein
MSPYNLMRAFLAITAVVVLSSIAPHVAAARPDPTPTAQCSRVPCGGSCVIAPSCTPGGPCPQFLILGQCTQDTSGTCRCVPAPLPTPTPTPTPCVDTVLCARGSHWSPAQCQCVPDSPEPTPTTCVDNVLCIRGSHWSPTACQCVPDTPEPTLAPTTCVNTILCIRGTRWSPTQCRCVRDRGPHTPHALSGLHSPHTIQTPHQPYTPG